MISGFYSQLERRKNPWSLSLIGRFPQQSISFCKIILKEIILIISNRHSQHSDFSIMKAILSNNLTVERPECWKLLKRSISFCKIIKKEILHYKNKAGLLEFPLPTTRTYFKGWPLQSFFEGSIPDDYI